MAEATGTKVKPIEERGYAHPEVLVSTEWVAEHLGDPKVRLVEADEDVLLYEVGHIPGAVKVDWVADLNDPLTRDYIDRERLEKLLRSRGIESGHDDCALRGQEQLVGDLHVLGAAAFWGGESADHGWGEGEVGEGGASADDGGAELSGGRHCGGGEG